MKRLIIPLLCLALACAALIGCGKGSSNEPATPGTDTPGTTVTAAPSTDAPSTDSPDATPAATQLLGGYEKPASPAVPAEASAALTKALEGFTGANYEPVAYLGKQVVNGTNYALLCRETKVVQNPTETWAIVIVYQDLQGNAKIAEVRDSGVATNLPTESVTGGWSIPQDLAVSSDLQAKFAKAMESKLGVSYTPIAVVAQQVVSGMNYAFLCEGTTTTANPETNYYIAIVYVDAQGNPSVTDITAFPAA